MNNLQKVTTNLLLSIISVSIPISLVDGYFKLKGIPSSNGRVMLLSGGNLNTKDSGIRSYSPNSLMRISAVYGKNLEFSYEFKTDKNGFRTTYICEDSPLSKGLIAITGDSFTEGYGSNESWASSIQESFCKNGYQSVNYATTGIGVIEMEKVLLFAKERLGAQKAVVAIIPHDVKRKFTRMVSNDSCSMNMNSQNKCGESTTWWHHPLDYSNQELVEFANTKYNFGIQSVAKNVLRPVKNKINSVFANFIPVDKSDIDIVKKSIMAMNRIANEYKPDNLTLYILPSKFEKNLSGTPEEKLSISNDLNLFLAGINKKIDVKDLRNCPLNANHFYKYDGHLNDYGQRSLGSCAVSKINQGK